MEKEPTVIIVASAEVDGYGGLKVLDNMGNTIKVNKAHEHLHKVFQVNRAVKVYWKYYDFDNKKGFSVDGAELFDGKPPPEQQVETITTRPKTIISGEERGMWYKELGCRIGDGSLERDYPNKAVRIKHEYYKKMSEVTGISFKED